MERVKIAGIRRLSVNGVRRAISFSAGIGGHVKIVLDQAQDPNSTMTSTASRTNVLITGTKAGIGLGLLALYASRSDTTVLAAVRDAPDSAIAKSMLSSITKLGTNSRVVPVRYDASNLTSARSMVEITKKQHPEIDHLDLVIANAAINSQLGPVADVTAEELENHLRVNATAPALLYQATRDLLLKTPAEVVPGPRFIYISTVAASLERTPSLPFPNIAYMMSKAAGNFFVVKANMEEDRLALVAVHPGWVQTEQGNKVAKKYGLEKAPMTIEDCCKKLADIGDKATKADMGGTFQTVDGGTLPW